MATLSLNVGDTFPSFDEFVCKLNAFQSEIFTQFIIKVGEKLPADDALFAMFKYSKVRYVCKQGNRVHKPKSSLATRQKQRSFKVGCPVMLNVRLNRPKGESPFLKITKMKLGHQNHQVCKEVFQLYPEQRRLVTDETDRYVLSSRTMKTSERRDILEKRHKTPVLTQDIYNMQRKTLMTKDGGLSDEQRCEALIKDVITMVGLEK
ncbi:hypothetical protein EGW08_022558 [Elysia chlorotica]|uniref:FAR1 domain-containing protein n=1 Tax=Elysia chlorotica TaxID=188477 RepID=A0A3S1H0A6_ELYCH|nr:hypothetical protein EGW08_022558 [Elysia chlorotica]